MEAVSGIEGLVSSVSESGVSLEVFYIIWKRLKIFGMEVMRHMDGICL